MGRALSRIAEVGVNIGAVLLFTMMVLTSSDVFMRAVFNHPIPGSIELSETALAMITYLTAAYTQRRKRHINVEFLVTRLSKKRQAVLGIITTAFSLIIVAVLAWQLVMYGLKMSSVGATLEVIQVIPRAPLIYTAAFGAALLFVQLIADLFDLLKTARSSKYANNIRTSEANTQAS